MLSGSHINRRLSPINIPYNTQIKPTDQYRSLIAIETPIGLQSMHSKRLYEILAAYTALGAGNRIIADSIKILHSSLV